MTATRIFIPNIHRNGSYALAVKAHEAGYQVYTSTEHPRMPYTGCRWIKAYLYLHTPSENNKSHSDTDKYLKRMLQFLHCHKIQVVFPSNDADIRIVVENRSVFEGYAVWAPDSELYETLSNKFSSISVLKELGVPVPECHTINDVSHAGSLLKLWGSPVIAKRSQSTGGRGVAMCYSKAEIGAFLAAERPIALQEWLSGNDEVSFHFLFDLNGKTIMRFSLRKYRHLAPSVSTSISIIEDPPEIELLERALKALNAKGFFVVQMRFCRRSKKYKLVEVNCRFGSNTRMLVILVPQLFSLFAMIREGRSDLDFVPIAPSVRCISRVEDTYAFLRNTYAYVLDHIIGGHRSQIASYRNFAGQFFCDMLNLHNRSDLLWRRLFTDTKGVMRMYVAMFRNCPLSLRSMQSMTLASVWCPPHVEAALAERHLRQKAQKRHSSRDYKYPNRD